jgi:heterodisulfide reductase subunit C
MSVEGPLQDIARKLARRIDARSCFQCGTCVAACPVARLTGGERYHPRRFVRETLEGRARALLDQPMLWLCSNCHACLEHCPQRVPVSELVRELRNVACGLGYAPADLATEVESILATGWALPPSDSANEQRRTLGLPPIENADRGSSDLRKIAKTTQLDARLKAIQKRRATETKTADQGTEAQ